jgi:hypothetical protein
MGLSIHYSGSFKNDSSLEAMIEEVKDIAEVYDWKYTIHNTHFPENTFGKLDYDGELYGISFTPPNSETISLTFLSNGKMCGGSNLLFFSDTLNEKDNAYLYMLSTKTQFAGSTIHKIIIHLLKHLSHKYFQDFKLIDEGAYWETGDEMVLENKFKIYTALLDSFSDSVSKYPKYKTESFTQYFERILKMIDNKRNKK